LPIQKSSIERFIPKSAGSSDDQAYLLLRDSRLNDIDNVIDVFTIAVPNGHEQLL
jgi:hypothetical protein